ncbi:TetR/AcrR family transcriptional regulator [Shewanella sp. SR44-3]|uniref:TetR/AcrR family transcriptional regulator n=1 Tax=Shewanella sp. SR44-3 TaxID=2760936 RepID=UPI0015FE7710|nr:TetR/AcrR family transcriptional regulator [Shewanella sp. SR44-3]MBB1269196.1 TetR/AcrR family transcriptional regulator [Shewanella sp. SR44-3]
MRNAEFDRKAVLCAAMSVFTAKGYAKTSMQDLTKATGLHPGSIYCAFENKKGLLLAAIGQYQDERNQQFIDIFNNNHSSLANLSDYLNEILNECLSDDMTKACLLTKTLNEVGTQDDDIKTLINKNLTAWQAALISVFDSAKQSNEINSQATSQELAQYLMMGIYGLRTFAHTQQDPEQLARLAKKLLADVSR